MDKRLLVLYLGIALIVGGYFFVRKGGAVRISQNGIDFIKSKEGFSETVYLDSAGLPTIGYGHLLRPGENYPNGLPAAAAEQLLRSDLTNAENTVNLYVSTPLTQNQFDALVSLTYNVGTAAFKNSDGSDTQLYKALQAGDMVTAAQKMLLFNRAGGVVNSGLVARRAQEQQIFLA